MEMRNHTLLLLLSVLVALLQSLPFAKPQSFIGINYGEVADNLPPPEATARLLEKLEVSKVRLYGADPAIIRALAGTNISITIGVPNGEIPSLAADSSFAHQWISENVLQFISSSKIDVIAVGNEVLSSGNSGLASQLLPAMQNIHNAVTAATVSANIKVSTVNTMAVLGQSDPPSTGAFHGELLSNIKGILQFLQNTGAPFMINPYPYFAYRSDPTPETLAFCLFRPNSGRFDAGSKITYHNMFDAQLDAVKMAMIMAGVKDVEIVVAETGWPYRGDSDAVGANVDNAKAFTSNLVTHLRSMVGTPLMPGRSVDTYIFALYDEDLKPGPASERSFGLFRPDLTPTYDAGLTKSSSSTKGNPSSSPSNNSTSSSALQGWCVPKKDATDAQLQSNLDYVCSHSSIDCRPIQEGGTCYTPNTVRSHAAYAMHQWFHVSGRHTWDCDFQQTATLTSANPSYDACKYTTDGN